MQIRLTPDYSLLVVFAIFLVNYFVVRRFFIAPISRVMHERERDVRSADELYEKSLTRFNDAMADIEQRIHETRKEGTGIREGLRKEALAHRETVIEQTRRQAEQIVAEAQARLTSDVADARAKIDVESEALARAAADKFLSTRAVS